MRIIVAESREAEQRALAGIVKRSRPDDKVTAFEDPEEAYEYALKNEPDVIFLETDLKGKDPVSLAKSLKEKYPRINIIFTASEDRLLYEAFKLHASGYILKPVSEEAVERELSDLRYPPMDRKKTVRISAFGKFTAFADDKPVVFKYSKSEEIFAILVDAFGKFVGTDRIRKLLWQDEDPVKNHASYISILKKDMISTFSKLGADHIFRQEGNETAIIPEAVKCDYFDYLTGVRGAEEFKGRYMERYAWAEPTVAVLENIRRERSMLHEQNKS